VTEIVEVAERAGFEASDPGSLPPSRLSRTGGWIRLLAAPAAVFAVVVGVWYLLSWRLLPVVLGRGSGPEVAARLRGTLLPYPHDVVASALLDPANLAELLSGLWLDVRLAFGGLAISIVVGVGAAVGMSQAKWVERSFYPYAIFLQTVPILALVPLIGLWFGFGLTARIFVTAMISLFPIITNTLFGLLSADRGLHDLFTLHTSSRWARLVKLQLPASLPAMFTGFQISAGLAVIGAIVGDFFFGRGEKGLGNLIQLYVNRLRPEMLFGALLFSTVLGLTVFLGFGWLRTRLTGWHESAGG